MRYAIIENEVVTNIILAPEEFISGSGLNGVALNDEHPAGIGWSYVDGAFAQPKERVSPRNSVFTPFGFLSIFSPEEQFKIANFEADPSVPEESKAEFRTFNLKYRVAQEIDLRDQNTRDGLGMLERIGILAPGRAAEILNGTVG